MDESLEEAALREAHEELGVDYQHLELLLKLSCVHQYDFDKPRYYGSTQFRGQEQEFALIYLHADDSAIQLARYEQELDKTCWCTSEEIIRKAEQRRTIGYKKAFLELSERGMLEKGRVKPDYLSATCK